MYHKLLIAAAIAIVGIGCTSSQHPNQFAADTIDHDDGTASRWVAWLEDKVVCVELEDQDRFCESFGTEVGEVAKVRVSQDRTGAMLVGVVPAPAEHVDIVHRSGARESVATIRSGDGLFFAWVIGFSTEPVVVSVEAYGVGDELLSEISVDVTE